MLITDGQVNYREAFTALLIENFSLSIEAWTYEELVVLRTYIGRELSARHPTEEKEDASSD